MGITDLHIDGGVQMRPRGKDRIAVYFGDRRYCLQPKCFRFLCTLARARLKSPPDEGFVRGEDFDEANREGVYKVMYQLRRQIPNGRALISGHTHGYYRLEIPPDRITINRKVIRAYPDPRVRALCE